MTDDAAGATSGAPTLPAELLARVRAAANSLHTSVDAFVAAACEAALRQDVDASSAGGVATASPGPPAHRDGSLGTLYMNEPIISIVDGHLHGEQTVAQALRHGDFGLGTLDLMDGEVVVLGGTAFQQDASGGSRVLTGRERTPFMTITRFDGARAATITAPALPDWDAVCDWLRRRFRSPNLVYAVHLEGHFPHVAARAVRKASEGTRLVDVARAQALFEFTDIRGSLVGFYSPHYLGSSITVPGFHLHLLSDDKTRGGHVLGCSVSEGATVRLLELHRTMVDLPRSSSFLDAALGLEGLHAELEEAERAHS